MISHHLRQLASESLVYGIAGIITRFLSVFLVPLYTRIFSPSDYGILSLVLASISLVKIFTVLALDNSAHRWYWDTEDEGDRKRTLSSWLWCQLATSTVAMILIVLFAGPLARAITVQTETAKYFILAALTLPLSVPETVVVNWLRMQRRPWVTVFYTLAINLTNVMLTIILVIKLNAGLTSVFVAQVIAAIMSSAVAIYVMRGWIGLGSFDWKRLREMLAFAMPLIPAALAFWVVNLSDRYFIQYYRSTHEVGLYAVGSSLAAVTVLITGAFQQAWGPFALSIHKRPDSRLVYATALNVYLWVTCLISAALTILAPEALRLLTTDIYVEASDVVGFLSLSYVVVGVSYIASIGTAIAKKNTPTGIAITGAAIINITLNAMLVPWFGKTGAALATLLSQSIVPLYVFYRAQNLCPIPYRFKSATMIVLVTILTMVLGLSVNSDLLIVNVFLKVGLLTISALLTLLLGVVPFSSIQNRLRAKFLN